MDVTSRGGGAENKERVIDDYRQYLDDRTRRGTVALRTVVDSLKECPMDVAMLTKNGIGKKVRGAVRVMRKLIKKIDNGGVVGEKRPMMK